MSDGFLSMGLVLAGISAAFLLTGIVALRLGFHGRRVDDHPICRKCGYDVFGVFPQTQVCPECGADLSRRRSVRIGKRERRRGLAIAGGVLLTIGTVGMVGTGWIAANRDRDWNQYKPVWWLIRDTRSANATVRNFAMKEISSRFTAGKLSRSNIVSVVDRALEAQGNSKEPWDVMWANLIESSQNGGKIPEGQWRTFLKQAVVSSLSIKARPKVSRGVPLVVHWWQGIGRLPAWDDRIYAEYRLEGGELGGQPLGQPYTAWRGSGYIRGTYAYGGGPLLRIEPAEMEKLSSGPQTLKLVVRSNVHYSKSGNAMRLRGQPGTEDRLEFAVPFELVDGPTVKVVNDESLRPAMEKSLRAEWGTEQDLPSTARSDNSSVLWVSIYVNSIPMSVSYDVVARIGGNEWALGSILVGARTIGGYGGSCKPRPEFKEITFDLVLRPNTAAAEQDISCAEIWGGEVVIKDVRRRK